MSGRMYGTCEAGEFKLLHRLMLLGEMIAARRAIWTIRLIILIKYMVWARTA